MYRIKGTETVLVLAAISVSLGIATSYPQTAAVIGKEVAIPVHMRDGQEYQVLLTALLHYGEKLFSAKWTSEEGEGRPVVKSTPNGPPLSNPDGRLSFPHNFNRISGPDSNSCSGCHDEPYEGGGGDLATSVFVLGQRFDFVTFDHADTIPTSGAVDENGRFVTLQNVADERRTIGMNGSGFIEMLARQMTADLQQIRDSIQPGQSKALVTKGISFGVLARLPNGSWDTSRVQGLAARSLNTEMDHQAS